MGNLLLDEVGATVEVMHTPNNAHPNNLTESSALFGAPNTWDIIDVPRPRLQIERRVYTRFLFLFTPFTHFKPSTTIGKEIHAQTPSAVSRDAGQTWSTEPHNVDLQNKTCCC